MLEGDQAACARTRVYAHHLGFGNGPGAADALVETHLLPFLLFPLQ